MWSESSYTQDQIEYLIEHTSKLFDVVRLVDPITMTTYAVERGHIRATDNSCCHVWNKCDRCENCISARCFMEHVRYSKFEFVDHDIYHVVAQPVLVDGEEYVLEVVTKIHDHVLLSAIGENEFIDRISSYNGVMYTDEVTGLANRHFLDERLELLEDRSAHDGTPLSVIMVDVDDFKEINDRLGHTKGDAALAKAASALRRVLRPSSEDTLARYGGDEFVAVIQGLSRAELEERLGSLEAIPLEDGLEVTFSVGAFHQEQAQIMDPKDLIDRADRVMYDVKQAGKRGFAVGE
ncbi:MAG: GGDEF domain-containing protein [Coriobacteriia bacterium]|nr:GGDEF domain-containing protein [Coriobacteriia bacterium]